MTTKLQKLGNSYGLILPKSVAAQLGAKPGTGMTFKVVGKELIFKVEEKSYRKKKITLDDLIKDFDPNTKHDEVDWGYAVGKEIIDDEYSK